MKKRIVGFVFASALAAAAVPAFAQFGALKSPIGGGSGPSVADFDSFLNRARTADGYINSSARHIFESVATKQEIDEVKAKSEAAKTKSDPKEQKAAQSEVNSFVLATLAKADYEAKAKHLEGKLEKKKAQNLGAAIWNFSLGALQDKELVTDGQKLVSGPPNPTTAPKLVEVKDVLGSVTGQMGNVSKIASGLVKLAKVAKIEKLPSSSAEPARPSDF